MAERLVVIPNMRELPPIAKVLHPASLPQAQATIHFYAGFPVHSRQQIVDVLSVMARGDHSLTAQQQAAIATLADQIGYLLYAEPDAAEFGSTTQLLHAAATTEPATVASSLYFLERSRATIKKLSMFLQQCLSLADLNNQLIAVVPNELTHCRF